jgi:hypothetical protein
MEHPGIKKIESMGIFASIAPGYIRGEGKGDHFSQEVEGQEYTQGQEIGALQLFGYQKG